MRGREVVAGIKCIKCPPVRTHWERSGRIKGFAVDCHEPVNQSHRRPKRAIYDITAVTAEPRGRCHHKGSRNSIICPGEVVQPHTDTFEDKDIKDQTVMTRNTTHYRSFSIPLDVFLLECWW